MQETFILYLHANDATQVSWAVLDANGRVRQHAYRDDVAALQSIAQDKRVIAIVPAEDILLAAKSMPKMSYSRLLQAIPYALEDELLTDVETLHFAIGQEENGSIPIAIVAHKKMREWLARLESWHIEVDECISAIYAIPAVPADLSRWGIPKGENRDSPPWVQAKALLSRSIETRKAFPRSSAGTPDAIPYAENSWRIMMLDNVVLVRTGLTQGFVVDPANLATLNLSLPAQEELPSEEEVAREITNHLPTFSINLCQGIYARKKSKLPPMTNLWKIVVGAASFWVALLFLSPLVSYAILKQQLNNVDAEINAIYKRQFPQATSVIAPKLRMEEKLQNINNQMGENRLLILLGTLGKVISKATNIKLNKLDFQQGQLTLEITATTSDDLSLLTDKLTQQSLNVKQQNATLSDTGMNATLVIE